MKHDIYIYIRACVYIITYIYIHVYHIIKQTHRLSFQRPTSQPSTADRLFSHSRLKCGSSFRLNC